MRLFALNTSRQLGESVGRALGRELDPHEEREFANGEHKARPLVRVDGEYVWVISSLHGDRHLDVNDKLCRLLFFTGALKDAGARHVAAVIPYLGYSRKDRRTQPNDPVTTRYVAAVLEAVGLDAIVTMDVHNPAAFDNAFRIPATNLTTCELFARHYARTSGNSIDSIVAPDLGGLKATRLFVDAYEAASGRALPYAVMDKKRRGGVVSGTGLIGDVGRHVLVVDDMIGSGTTLCRAASACLEAGAQRVSVGATHGLFEGGAPQLFEQPGIDSITVTDTVAVDELGLPNEHLARIETISAAPLFADYLRPAIAGTGEADPDSIS